MRILATGLILMATFLLGYDKGVHDVLCEAAKRQMLVAGQGSGPVTADGSVCAPWVPFSPPKADPNQTPKNCSGGSGFYTCWGEEPGK